MFKRLHPAPWTDRYGTSSLIYRLLVEQGRRHWRSYALSFAFMGVAAACTSATAYLIGHVVNDAYVSHNFPAVVALCVATIVIFTVKGLAFYGQAVALAKLTNEITAENQQLIFDKLLHENVGYFANRHSSTLMAQVAYGAAAVPSVLNLLITAMGRDGLTLVGLAAVMVIQDPLMSLIGLVVVPPAALFLRKLVERVRNATRNQFSGTAAIMEVMQESLQGMRVVKAFGLEDEMRRRVAAGAESMKRAGKELARLSNRAIPLMEWLGGCAVALAFLYAGFRVIETEATPGQFVSFIAAFLLAFEPAKRLARVNLDLQSGLVGVRILYELLDSPPTEPDDEDKPPLRVSAGQLEFVNVEFDYRTEEPVIKGMSFIAEPGRVTALVGPSGGGKSTMFSLILRFYDVGSGTITIDGQDISTISRRSLRRQIAFMGQDVFLFRGSVRDNIAAGKAGAGEEEIVAAARAAFAHDFIINFPQGYDTPVGEHGMQLSTGQRQRIAVARALLRDAPIILLDEPTASLDTESEQEVQRAITRLCNGRTTLVIAHRLHTVVDADCIHVIENGSIVESGSHKELLDRSGRYATLFRLLLSHDGTTDQTEPTPPLQPQ